VTEVIVISGRINNSFLCSWKNGIEQFSAPLVEILDVFLHSSDSVTGDPQTHPCDHFPVKNMQLIGHDDLASAKQMGSCYLYAPTRH
jgi:hypothetical protein